MTLILTELSEHGVAMAADTALTKKVVLEGGKSEYHVSYEAVKLQPIRELSAGISFHGIGLLGDTRTDEWIADFIKRNARSHDSMKSFGDALANELSSKKPPIKDTLGFHLAGFAQVENDRYPTVYKIINAPDGKFQCYHSESPHKYLKGAHKPLRGGEDAIYAKAFEILENWLKIPSFGEEPFHMPYPDNLRMRAEYLRFQIVMVSDIYLLSNQVPLIGGPVTTLSISPRGIEDYETRAEITREGS